MSVKKISIQKIKREIFRMVKQDQQLRYAGKVDEIIDRANTEKLKIIISQIGWPKISQVGKKVATGAFLLVQHSVYDSSFQKKCLKLITEAAKIGEADAKLVPLLVDRILVSEGKKQIYGTQFYKDKKSGQLMPRPIKNPSQVDKVRKSVGLEPLDSYQRILNKSNKKIEDQK
ncbi:MAG: hypothetical protein A3A98_01375 [Candidatus Staskawiczbacteria bacterium RIFCSPLOWO2_01_FULL_40_39]|nr:MAG: hypothetical protein A3A98_01375 [Candidatus Staskawiczbacteria bacterium RIFCSPLOWO2_01_FULL_40_39]